MATQVVQPGTQQDEYSDNNNQLDSQAAAFQALEQRVLRAIDLLRKERELRANAEQQLHQAEEHGLEMELRVEEQNGQLSENFTRIDAQNVQLSEQAEQLRRLESERAQLQGERDQVRQRVEKLLQHLDEFTGA